MIGLAVRWAVVVLTSFGLSVAAERTSLAGAPDDAQRDRMAEALLARAVAAFADGAFGEARALLEQAGAAARGRALRGRIHLQLGLVHAAENRLPEARRSFQLALENDPNLNLDEQQNKPAFVELFRSVRHDLEGILEVTVDRGGVDVWARGRRAGTPPLRVRLLPGACDISVRDQSGKILHQSSLQIVSGQVSRLAVALAATEPPPPVELPAQPPRRRRIWTWVAAGGAAAFAAVAIGTGVSARSDEADACRMFGDQDKPCEERRHLLDSDSQPRYRDLYDAATRKALVSNIAWGTAAALAVGAVVLYWLEGRPRTPARRARLDARTTAARVNVELSF